MKKRRKAPKIAEIATISPSLAGPTVTSGDQINVVKMLIKTMIIPHFRLNVLKKHIFVQAMIPSAMRHTNDSTDFGTISALKNDKFVGKTRKNRQRSAKSYRNGHFSAKDACTRLAHRNSPFSKEELRVFSEKKPIKIAKSGDIPKKDRILATARGGQLLLPARHSAEPGR